MDINTRNNASTARTNPAIGSINSDQAQSVSKIAQSRAYVAEISSVSTAHKQAANRTQTDKFIRSTAALALTYNKSAAHRNNSNYPVNSGVKTANSTALQNRQADAETYSTSYSVYPHNTQISRQAQSAIASYQQVHYSASDQELLHRIEVTV